MRLDFGDIVKPRFFGNGVEYYIVTDIDDYTLETCEEKITYELMKIYPVQEKSETSYKTVRDVSLIGNMNKSQGKTVMQFVSKERNKFGIKKHPDYLSAISENIKNTELVRVKKTDMDDKSFVRYDKIKDIDSCLDALNDLDRFYSIFGDEAYLQLKDIVFKRMKELA